MTPMINVDGLIWFTSADVLLTRAGCNAAITDPDRLLAAIRTAVPLMANRHLIDANCGAKGALQGYDTLELEEFLTLVTEIDIGERQAAATRNARLLAMRQRRADFAALRPDLVLKMIAAGVTYRCTHPACVVIENLTVDHITPISKGGTDDLSNLQFLCAPHNSAKGNRI